MQELVVTLLFPTFRWKPNHLKKTGRESLRNLMRSRRWHHRACGLLKDVVSSPSSNAQFSYVFLYDIADMAGYWSTHPMNFWEDTVRRLWFFCGYGSLLFWWTERLGIRPLVISEGWKTTMRPFVSELLSIVIRMNSKVYLGKFLTTLAEVTLNGGSVRESRPKSP